MLWTTEKVISSSVLGEKHVLRQKARTTQAVNIFQHFKIL